MRQVRATQAKARLAALLREVERGETIEITRQGKAVAHLVPADVQNLAERKRAVNKLRQLRAEWGDHVPFTVGEILAARHQSHRA